jgi:hypothetical protein
MEKIHCSLGAGILKTAVTSVLEAKTLQYTRERTAGG